MRVYSYVITRDFGFAPNPFYGYCTLATCKPRIRASAQVGDWVVATASKATGHHGHLVYAVQISEALSFDAYWADPRYACKRPVLNGSLKQIYGDNIYHREHGAWVQSDSHHSFAGGQVNPVNLKQDTSSDRVLLGDRFAYFGRLPVMIPGHLRRLAGTGEDLCFQGRGHRATGEAMAQALESWLDGMSRWGRQHMPAEFDRHRRAIGPTRGAP